MANVHIPNEPLTRCHKGYAFVGAPDPAVCCRGLFVPEVTMTTSSEAQDCIRALHLAELGGRWL